MRAVTSARVARTTQDLAQNSARATCSVRLMNNNLVPHAFLTLTACNRKSKALIEK